MNRVELDGVTRKFEPDFTALDRISLAFNRGEIHTILGENGAGKSTLVHILSGLLAPTSGSLRIDGEEVRFSSTRDALDRGIAMVHQRPLLSGKLTVLENALVGATGLFIDRRALQQKIANIAEAWDISLDLARPARTLAPQDRLRTALLAALFREPSFLILDEPTAVLSPDERDRFMESLVRARSAGLGIIVITHKLHEAVRWSDRVSVLRHGKLAFSSPVDGGGTAAPVTEENLASFFSKPIEADEATSGDESQAPGRGITFSVDSLSVNLQNRPALSGVSFRAEPGTVTGIFGLPGSGIDVLEDLLSGMVEADTGTVSFFHGGEPEGSKTSLSGRSINPRNLRAAGARFVPSDRAFRGSNPELTVRDILLAYRKTGRGEADRFVEKILREEEINVSPARKARTLSGGQLQRLILARELAENPGVLILAEPEWGLDIGSADRFRKRLVSAAASGMTAIVLTDSPDTMKNAGMYRAVHRLDEGRLR